MPELTTECRLLSEILEELRAQRRASRDVSAQLEILTVAVQTADAGFVGEARVISLPNTATNSTPVLIAVASDEAVVVRCETDGSNSARVFILQTRESSGVVASMATNTRRAFVLRPGQQLFARLDADGSTGTVLVTVISRRAVAARVLDETR